MTSQRAKEPIGSKVTRGAAKMFGAGLWLIALITESIHLKQSSQSLTSPLSALMNKCQNIST